jgi:hypothetical protein
VRLLYASPSWYRRPSDISVGRVFQDFSILRAIGRSIFSLVFVVLVGRFITSCKQERRRFMIEHGLTDNRMVAMQLTTDEGAFLCNVKANDVVKVAAKETGVFVVVYCAIRLDAMFEGQYELYRTKTIETSSVDFCRPFERKARILRKRQPLAYAIKGKK